MPSASKAAKRRNARPSRAAKAAKRPPARAPARPAARPARPAQPAKPAGKPTPKGGARPTPKASGKSAPAAKVPEAELEVPLPGGRRHVLSLAFVRDGDEFLARMETDSGHITELKNRSLDQLLTLVAGELEDLLE
ncbi:MAG TPA: hypothetical protein VMG36_05220 [Thermoplasmata archaeon]|nr:hypothetical protein [Thermoplasmata archaeon]